MDDKKSLADLLYYNELAIRDRISERMTFIKMFKSSVNYSNEEGPTKTYDRNKLAHKISRLSFFKIIEDNFNYKEADINEQFARDVSV